MRLRSKERRTKREKKFIMKEFEKRVKFFVTDISKIVEDIEESNKYDWIKRFIFYVPIFQDYLMEHDERWCNYDENKRKDPKYHVAPKDNDMFIEHGSYLIVKYFLDKCNYTKAAIHKLYPERRCKDDFVNEIHKVICGEYLEKESKKYNITEIQKRNFFYAILNVMHWFVFLLRKK